MLHIITGLPLSGKSTFVRNNAKAGDVIIDLDQIARALTITEQSHDYPLHIRQLAIKARQAVINQIMAANLSNLEVWLIHADPSELQLNQYLRKGAKIHKLELTYDQLKERMATRPEINQAKINQFLQRKMLQASGEID